MKAKRCLCAILMLTIVLVSSFSVSASETSAANCSASQFLSNYLTKLVSGNTAEAFAMMQDNRLTIEPTLNRAALSSAELGQIQSVENGTYFSTEYQEEAISDFEILTATSNTGNTILTKLYFVNGAESIVPFDVIPNGDSYIISITTDDISEKGYESLVESNEVPDFTAPTPRYSGYQRLDDYDFWYLYGTIYGIDTFNISKWVINFDGEQWNDAYEAGWELPASVIYSVVKKHWYGDDVWGTTSNPIVMNGSFDVHIQGKNNNTSGACIRIANTTGASPRSKGSGVVYQCDN